MEQKVGHFLNLFFIAAHHHGDGCQVAGAYTTVNRQAIFEDDEDCE
jgi:hypothetical protein